MGHDFIPEYTIHEQHEGEASQTKYNGEHDNNDLDSVSQQQSKIICASFGKANTLDRPFLIASILVLLWLLVANFRIWNPIIFTSLRPEYRTAAVSVIQ
jgi:hypothetical protein